MPILFVKYNNKAYYGSSNHGMNLSCISKGKFIKQIGCSNTHSILYMEDGDLEVFHHNDCDYHKYTLTNDITIKKIYCINNYTIIHRYNDQVYIFRDIDTNYNKPLLIIDNVKNIYSTSTFILIHINTGDIYAFGLSSYHIIGVIGVYELVWILEDPNIINISIGNGYAIIQQMNGEYEIRYSITQKGGSINKNIKMPESVKYKTLIFDNNGELHQMENRMTSNISIGTTTNVKYIAMSGAITLVYKNISELWIYSKYFNTIICKEAGITHLMNSKIDNKWSIENHKKYSKDFRDQIFTFYICNKHYPYKLPKFVCFEIFKFLL